MQNFHSFQLPLQLTPQIFMKRVWLPAVQAVAMAGVGAARQEIPIGGPIPDRRGFNSKVDDPKLTSEVVEVVKRVAGNVYVIAGAGGNIVVQAGPDG